jgi:uncharacterized protein YndB with AHSA1/START domain
MPQAAQVTLPSDLEVAVTRQFNAPRQLVFDAHMKPELVQRWVLGPPGWTMPVCEIDGRVGGRYTYRWRNEETGHEFGMTGVYEEISPPDRIVLVETFEDQSSLVTTTLSEAGGVTTLVTTMKFASKEARDGAVASGMTDGMEMGYQRLDQMVADAAR